MTEATIEILETIWRNRTPEAALAVLPTVIRTLKLASAVPAAPETIPGEPERSVAWLIEWPQSETLWARWWHTVKGWVIDPNNAPRFVRREDAQAWIDAKGFVGGVVPTEHIFIGAKWDAPAVSQRQADTRETGNG